MDLESLVELKPFYVDKRGKKYYLYEIQKLFDWNLDYVLPDEVWSAYMDDSLKPYFDEVERIGRERIRTKGEHEMMAYMDLKMRAHMAEKKRKATEDESS